MAALEGTPEYQASPIDKAFSWVSKRAPDVIGRAIQYMLYWIWKGVQFIGQMFHDAIGR